MASVSMSFSGGLRRAESVTEFRGDPIGMRRSSSEPVLRCAVDTSKSISAETKIKTSRSIGIFPLTVDSAKEMRLTDADGEDEEMEGEAFVEGRKRVNWIDRLLELRRVWKDRRQKDDEEDEDVEEEDDGHCEVSYGDDEEEFDSDSFSKYLMAVPWTTTKLFSKLAFLCNMSYRIPDIKAEHLKTHYGLDLVTSSLAKKSKPKSTMAVGRGLVVEEESKVVVGSSYSYPPPTRDRTRKRRTRPSIAYQIAASAASYVHSRAKGILSFGGEEQNANANANAATSNGEVAACMAASTMAAVVAVEETAKQEAAKDLQSLHSSPCEWFVCDDHSTCTRYFVTQGSDSLKSWQVNLLFEPTKFEGTSSLVHRGIYEAAKGLYEQFLPDIEEHLERYGEKAKLLFTGHSLGGSLSLLVNLMLLSRGVVDRNKLLPVVTFGSPFVFCGGRTALTQLGFDEEEQLYSVMMHRDIVPRAFSCTYSDHVSQILKRLNGTFRSHPCLNREKLLYSPLGKLFVLQPDDKFSPSHPFLPVGRGLYALDSSDASSLHGALKAFLNSPHPLETLSDLKAYGSDGTILRDHDSGNYLKAVNGVLRERTRSVLVRRSRKQSLQRHHHRWQHLEKALVLAEEIATGI